MTQHARRALDEYLALEYPFHVIASRDGGYVVVYPDLPGCITQAETLDELTEMADEARQLWIESEYEDGHDIPLPSYPEEYSGKFVARLPRSLHRQLAEEAERQSVSLNQHVVALLSRRDAQSRMEQQLKELDQRLSVRLDMISGQVESLRFQMKDVSLKGGGRSHASYERSATQRGRQPYGIQAVAS